MAQTIKLTLPQLHEAQIQIKQESKRFNVLCCGRRWGKSFLGCDLVVHPALQRYPVGWFSPSYKMLIEVWRDIKALLAPVTARCSEVDRRIELVTGGVVEFWSLDNPDAGRGRKYKRVIIDEAAMVPKLELAWQDGIRPTLTDYGGDAWFLSTPKGKNYFYTLYMRGQDECSGEWASWQMPTIANPYMPAGEVELARNDMPALSFAQEYLAEFNDDASGVFRRVNEAIDAGRTANEDRKPDYRYFMGVDLARVNDFTVLTVFDDTGRQVYHERFNQISWSRQIDAIVRVAKLYNALVVIDSTGVGDPIYQEVIQKYGNVIKCVLNNTNKRQMVDNLAVALDNSRVRLMDIPVQTAELQAYEYDVTDFGNVRMNAPSGMHDDCVMSMVLAFSRCPLFVHAEKGEPAPIGGRTPRGIRNKANQYVKRETEEYN